MASWRSTPTRSALIRVVALVVGLLCTAACSGPPSPAPTAAPPRPLRVLVFGDSYTLGSGADPLSEGYAYQLGRTLDWDVTVDGAGGTGYLAPGPRNTGPFEKRLASAAPGPFDLVVLQGSSNDERQPLAALPAAVDRTVNAARTRYPGARIVLLGPIALYGSVPDGKAAVNDTLRHYAADHQVAFVDAIAGSWFAHGESKYLANAENGHPNNAGYTRIRERLIIDLARLAPAPAPA